MCPSQTRIVAIPHFSLFHGRSIIVALPLTQSITAILDSSHRFLQQSPSRDPLNSSFERSKTSKKRAFELRVPNRISYS
jgi:hypothetical protein